MHSERNEVISAAKVPAGQMELANVDGVPASQYLPPRHGCGGFISPSQYIPGAHRTHDKLDELEILNPGRHKQRAKPATQTGTKKSEQPAGGNVDVLQKPI